MKKTLIVLFASLALTGCAETEVVEDEAVDDETEVVEVVEDEVVEDKVEETEVELVEVEPAEDELTRDQSIRLVELMMAEAFEETGEVGYSIIHDALVYTPTDPQFSIEMAQMVLGTLDRSSWDDMVESFRQLSGTISEKVDDLGIVVMNPENEDRIVLMVRDGVVEYDFMEDEQ